MKTVRKLDKPVTEIEEIFCNKCGLSMKSPQGCYYGLVEAEIVAGYESTHLEDGDVHKLSLCEACLSQIFEECTYPTLQGNYISEEVPHAKDFDPEHYFFSRPQPDDDDDDDDKAESLIENMDLTEYVPYEGDEDGEQVELLCPVSLKKKEDLN